MDERVLDRRLAAVVRKDTIHIGTVGALYVENKGQRFVIYPAKFSGDYASCVDRSEMKK